MIPNNQFFKSIPSGGGGYDADAQLYFDRLPDDIANYAKIAINNFVVGVKQDEGISNLSDKFIKIHIRPAAVGGYSNALINLASTNFDTTVNIDGNPSSIYYNQKGLRLILDILVF